MNLTFPKVELFTTLLPAAALPFHHVNQNSNDILRKNKFSKEDCSVISEMILSSVCKQMFRQILLKFFAAISRKATLTKDSFSFVWVAKENYSCVEILLKTNDSNHAYNCKKPGLLFTYWVLSTPTNQKEKQTNKPALRIKYAFS